MGTGDGAPWESRKADWAHFAVRLGRLTSCAVGEARKAPKPNERGYRNRNHALHAEGCSEHRDAREVTERIGVAEATRVVSATRGVTVDRTSSSSRVSHFST